MFDHLMSDVEKQKAASWLQKHDGCGDGAAIGGAITYCFTPTGVGLVVILQCGLCKEEINVTDFDSW